ncbi:MAG: glycosyltransferase [Bacteroidaceae bacterium]|nr:glycosyltransferase [Bacteroidaceae bacterium]
MKLSVITINYNNLAGLRKTIDSVLTQTSREFEWIIIDGGSTDGSRVLLEKNAEKIDYWVSEPDKGIYNAMNKGINVAKGDYFLFLNSGDFFASPDVVRNILPHLCETDYVIANVASIDAQGKIGQPTNYVGFISGDKKFWYNSTVSHQGMFIKGQTLKDNPYNESHKIVADWEHAFIQLIVKNGTFKVVENYVVNVLDGGFSMVNAQAREKERKEVAELYFSREFLDKMFLESLMTRKYKNYAADIASVACAIGMNTSYSDDKLSEILEPYRSVITKNGSIQVRLFNWLNLHKCRFLTKKIVEYKTKSHIPM